MCQPFVGIRMIRIKFDGLLIATSNVGHFTFPDSIRVR